MIPRTPLKDGAQKSLSRREKIVDPAWICATAALCFRVLTPLSLLFVLDLLLGHLSKPKRACRLARRTADATDEAMGYCIYSNVLDKTYSLREKCMAVDG